MLHHNPCTMTLSRSQMFRSLATLVVWVLVALSLAYWALKVAAGSRAPRDLPVAAAPQPATDPLAVGRLLGAVAQPAAVQQQVNVASRFSLLGVVAGSPGGGAALIAVDGQPAKPFRVGSPVDQNLFVQSANGRQVKLAASQNDPAAIVLELPPLKN
jgi:general secretion pathway protein C